MKFTREEVLAVAKLARIEIDESRAQSLPEELSKIVTYVQKLAELNTEGVEPTTQVSVEAAPLRPDVVEVGVDKAQDLKAAPRANDVGFLVPGFVDES
jgi:aspartyl-tRNA(Asn)/glutamyl-tRNA(Gln) amidotransferase subunit C